MNIKKLLKSGVFFTLLFGFTQSFAWQMVYHNDENGNVVSGKLEVLIDAINNGHNVRVMREINGIKNVVDADEIYIKDNKVYMTNTRAISIQEDGTKYKFQPTAYHFFILYDTDGNFHMSRWLVGINQKLSEEYMNVDLKWFID
ncbi:hypothetical protein [Arcobacter sp. F2176]|uniref:hypothetical protein n=1 Tax=Arcobacter sp. F2176 TaxID=2044511 RepID=UPI00100A68D3|nr:hypothetical protein [Arcobacter sp. F2176]RXJ79022.1 hypothetical protein CRU95_15350 [Arcobacter sp. F2176]